MKTASISKTKNHLSALLEEVQRGETVVITDHNRPIARLERLEQSPDGSDIPWLIQAGILSPAAQRPDIQALLKLPRAIAPQACLAAAVDEDREGR